MDKLTAAKYFIRVADTGSFSKTAKELDVPVSTISRRVKDLEQHLGIELFKRSTRYLSLTELGQTYYNQVKQAVRDFEMADMILQERSTTPSGKIKISALPSYANPHLYQILEKFRRLYPEIMIELLTTDTVQDLMKDNIDFAIRPTNTPPENLVARVIDEHRMAIVASPEYIKEFGALKTPSEVSNHKTIFYGTPNGQLDWHALYEKKWEKIKTTPHFMCSDTCKILDIVAHGGGIALLPEWTYLESLNKGLVEKANIGWDVSFRANFDHRLYLIYDKKTSQLKRNQTFLKFFLKEIK